MHEFILPLALSALAGLSTTIGSLFVFVNRRPGPIFMSLIMGFSAGVMIFISFSELLQAGVETLGFIYGNAAFFGGIVFMWLIDMLIPHDYMLEKHTSPLSADKKLQRTALFIALGIAIHNFPEGIATFASAVKDINLGIPMALAIAVHNIPEGIAVAVPIYAATKNIKKAFWWSFLSGVSEPIGAGLAALFLGAFLTESVLAFMLSFVGGLMIFISFDELLPMSRSYGKEHTTILGVTIGMFVMFVSLAIF